MYWSLENVPWTNLHNLNLDWIINTMKQTVEQWIAYRLEMNQKYDDFTNQINTDFNDFTTQINTWKTLIENEFSDLQTYVQNYFDNLDLNESTRYVINQMIASGEFVEVLNPSVTATVEQWLTDHITPTTPAVDDTLTISGAAADAKAAGDKIKNTNDFIRLTNNNANLYKNTFITMPYEQHIFLNYLIGNVGAYAETIEDSSRCFAKIPDSVIIDSSIYIYNPVKYRIGIYKRLKTDNHYEGYHLQTTTEVFTIVDDLNLTQYDYYFIVIHYTGETESNWTESDVFKMSKEISLYSGVYYNNKNAIGIANTSNLAKNIPIHTGKYYYGAATMGNNAQMVYTDIIPVKEMTEYCFPYITLGYSWFGYDGVKVLGGAYNAVENVEDRAVNIKLVAPAGAYYIGLSVRSGDADNIVLSELPNSKSEIQNISVLEIPKSKILREPLNYLYNTAFPGNRSGSRLISGGPSGTVAFEPGKVALTPQGYLASSDVISMDKNKLSVTVSIPFGSNNNNFVIGLSGKYASPPYSVSNGAIGLQFRLPSNTVQVRYGTGTNGNYETDIKYINISSLNIPNARKFIVTIEKNTINKYTISIYDATCPNVYITDTLEAAVDPEDENLYSSIIRGWGGPYIYCHVGTVYVHDVKMYSTAPTYPQIAIWGDSYVENFGRNPLCSYAYRIRDALNGNAFLSGLGGATSTDGVRRVAVEINTCSPQYIIYNFGVNDSFNITAETFKTNILKLIQMALDKNAEPILTTVPNVPAGNSTTAAFCTTVNPWIKSLGYKYIDIAAALSTGDGITGDSNKFVSDGTHPNIFGGNAIYKYIEANLPFLLWKQ